MALEAAVGEELTPGFVATLAAGSVANKVQQAPRQSLEPPSAAELGGDDGGDGGDAAAARAREKLGLNDSSDDDEVVLEEAEGARDVARAVHTLQASRAPHSSARLISIPVQRSRSALTSASTLQRGRPS